VVLFFCDLKFRDYQTGIMTYEVIPFEVIPYEVIFFGVMPFEIITNKVLPSYVNLLTIDS